jgi:hypothetical protein
MCKQVALDTLRCLQLVQLENASFPVNSSNKWITLVYGSTVYFHATKEMNELLYGSASVHTNKATIVRPCLAYG